MKRTLIKIYLFLIDKWRILINEKFWPKIKKPIVNSAEQAIERIINDGCSMCRFGDGEFSLIKGSDLKFQKYSKSISLELKSILQCPIEKNNVIICIPDVFGSLEQYTFSAQKYWKKYLRVQRSSIYQLLRFEKMYYDTQITRFYMDYADKSNMEKKVFLLRKMWESRRVLIVEGEKSRLGMGNDLFDNAFSIKRLICPAINAYEYVDKIENEILSIKGYDLVLIALGPTATVLSFRLANKGVQALDIGHIDIEYEWYLNGVLLKKPVQNKYIGEMPGGDAVSDNVDEKYKAQIVGRIIE